MKFHQCVNKKKYDNERIGGNIVRDISEKCGGSGGGHSVACGAYIPEENMGKFIDLLNNSVNIS